MENPMPRHYSPDHKAAALECLQANGGDIAATHFQTGIPYRTLYTWRRELWIQQVKQRQSSPPLLQNELPEFEEIEEGLVGLRQEIIAVLRKLSTTPLPMANTFLLADRVRAQTGLVDCFLRLDAFLAPYLQRLSDPFPGSHSPWSHQDERNEQSMYA
jgi:transposase-like protein